MSVYLKLLYDIAESEEGMMSYDEIQKKYGEEVFDVRILSYSDYFEKIIVDNEYYLRLRLKGYVLVNELKTNRASRFSAYSAFILSIISLLISVTTLIIGLTNVA